MSIQAVVFDWGGVLIEDPAPVLMSHCAQAWGVSLVQYRAAHQQHAVAFQTGTVSEIEFWHLIGQVLGKPVPTQASLWTEAFRQAYQVRKGIFDWIRVLRAIGIRIGLLSNTEAPVVRLWPELGYDVFDVTVFSCVEGCSKPDPRIYHITLERLDVAATETAFFDDRLDCIQGASDVGMHAFLFRGLDQARADLGVQERL